MSYMKYIKYQVVKPIDYFGKSIEFNIMGKKNVKSIFGGILTIFLVFIFIFILSNNILKYLKKEPVVRLEIQPFNLDEFYYIPKKIFQFSSLINNLNKDFSNSPLKSSPYATKSFNKKVDFSETDIINIGNITSCNKVNNFTSENEFSFNKIGREYFTCFDIREDLENIKMGGSILGKNGQYEVEIFYKQNITKSENGHVIYLSFINNIINPENICGFRNFADTYSLFLDKGSKITIIDRVVKNVIRTDMNFIYNLYPHVDNTFYTHYINIAKQEKSDDDMSIDIHFIFYLDLLFNNYYRSYMKFDTVIVNSLSMCQSIVILLKIIDSIFNYQSLGNELIKCLYIVDKDNYISSLEIKNQRKGNLNSISTMRNINIPTNNISNITNIKNNKSNNIMRINKNNKLLAKMTSNLLEHDLNIIVILRKLIEYENLKSILLEDYQIKGLKVTNRRLLSKYIEDNNSFKEINEEYDSNNLIERNYIFNKSSISRIDMRLKQILN